MIKKKKGEKEKKRKEIWAVLRAPQTGNGTLPLDFWGRKDKKRRARREDRGMGDPPGPRDALLSPPAGGYSLLPPPAGTWAKRKGLPRGPGAPGAAPLPVPWVRGGEPVPRHPASERGAREKPSLAECLRCKITIKLPQKLFHNQAGVGGCVGGSSN